MERSEVKTTQTDRQTGGNGIPGPCRAVTVDMIKKTSAQLEKAKVECMSSYSGRSEDEEKAVDRRIQNDRFEQ